MTIISSLRFLYVLGDLAHGALYASLWRPLILTQFPELNRKKVIFRRPNSSSSRTLPRAIALLGLQCPSEQRWPAASTNNYLSLDWAADKLGYLTDSLSENSFKENSPCLLASLLT